MRLVTTDLPEAPAYFSRDVSINREGAPELAELPEPAPLAPDEVARLQEEGAAILDTRTSAEYGTAHVPGSVQIGLSGQFASWAGSLLSPESAIVLVAEDPDRAREARMRLARVGLENVVGYLDGGIAAWERSGRPLAATEQITVDELERRLKEGGELRVVDVRRPMEWQARSHRGRAARPVERASRARRKRSSHRARSRSCAAAATDPRSRRASSSAAGSAG